MKAKFSLIICCSMCVLVQVCNADNIIKKWNQNEPNPWSFMLYRGTTAEEKLEEVLLGRYHSAGETIYSAELAYIMYKKQPWFLIQLAGNIAGRFADHSKMVPEADLYGMLRYTNFPWNKYLLTTLAVGDGFSYAAGIPAVEGEGSKNMLNYLIFELTFALPRYPNLRLVGRIHHRSSVFNLYAGAERTGSNNVGIGIRYYFSI